MLTVVQTKRGIMALAVVPTVEVRLLYPCLYLPLKLGLGSVQSADTNDCEASERPIPLDPSEYTTALRAMTANATQPIQVLDKWCMPFHLPRPQPDLFPQIPAAWQGQAAEGPSAAEIAASPTARQAFQVRICPRQVRSE